MTSEKLASSGISSAARIKGEKMISEMRSLSKPFRQDVLWISRWVPLKNLVSHRMPR